MGKKATIKLLKKAGKRAGKLHTGKANKKMIREIIPKFNSKGGKRKKPIRKDDDDTREPEDDFEVTAAKERLENLKEKQKSLDSRKKLKKSLENDDSEEEEENGDDDDDDNDILGDDDEDDDEDAVKQHKKELEELKEQDPEFYKMLQEEGDDLLHFGEEEEEEEEKSKNVDMDDGYDDDDDDQEEENEEEEYENIEKNKIKKSVKRPRKIIVSTEILKEIHSEAINNTKSMSSLRMLVQVFRAACRMTDPNISSAEEKVNNKFFIESGSMFQEVMVTSLTTAYKVFDSKLWPKKNNNATDKKKSKENEMEKVEQDDNNLQNEDPSRSVHWKSIESNIKVFLGTLIRFLEQAQDPSMVRYILQNCRFYSKYFAVYPLSFGKRFLKVLLQLWSETEDSTVAISAFLRIRQLTIIDPASFLELGFRSLYMSFVRGAKFSSSIIIEKISLQARCLVELAGIDLITTYQLGFVYIRKLALLLKESISAKSVESMQSIYSWQYVHSLRLWGAILCAHHGNRGKISSSSSNNNNNNNKGNNEDALRPLIYPLTQIIIGAIQLVPTARNFPLRLHCVDVLIKLERSTCTFIPIDGLLLPILRAKELFNKKPIPSTAKPPEFAYTLRCRKKELLTAQHLEMIVNSTLQMLHEHLGYYRHSVCLPELAFPVAACLRSFGRETKISRWRNSAKKLLKELEEWSVVVIKDRAQCGFGPADDHKIREFSRFDEIVPDAASFFSFSVENNNDSAASSSSVSNKKRNNKEVSKNNKNNNKNKPKVSHEEEEEEEENDDDNDDVEKIQSKKKKSKVNKQSMTNDDDDDDGGGDNKNVEDIVEDLVWSDIEDENF